MIYVEYLRVRRAFFIYAAIVAMIMLIVVLSMHNASLHHGSAQVGITIGSDAPSKADRHAVSSLLANVQIPLGLLLGIAGYCSVVFATVLAASLNKENDGAHFAFTKPISRERLGLAYMIVDAIGIVSAFSFAFIAGCIVPLAAFGVLSNIVIDARGIWIGLLGLGTAFMWYGVLQALTAAYKGRGGTIVGFSWAVFVLLLAGPSLTILGPVFLGLVHAINFLNPLAYFSGIESSSHGGLSVGSIFAIGIEWRALIVWCIALVASGLAIVSWKRVEV